MLNVTWSVQTLLLVPAQITYFQALVSVLQVTETRRFIKPTNTGRPVLFCPEDKGAKNLADPVCMHRTLGHKEEAGGTDGALLAARAAAAEAAVLVRAAAPARQVGVADLTTSHFTSLPV